MISANVKDVYKINKANWFKRLGYIPHEGQWEVHNDESRFRVVVSGRRWGKSMTAAKEAESMLLLPNTRGWVVSKTYDLTMKVIREIQSDMLLNQRLKPSRMVTAGPIKLEFPWGSVVEGKSAEHPESLLGEGLEWLVFDECAFCKSSIWERYLRPTLTDNEGWALFITTPNGYNWVYDLWKRGYDSDNPEWSNHKSPSWDNPHISHDDIEDARKTLSNAVFMQEYGANFTLASGQVYHEFDEMVHIVPSDKLIIDPAWKRCRAIDFGYENPFACLYIAVDPEDRVFVYDEYYHRHRTVEQHAENLNKDSQKYEYTVCDPSGLSARATLLEHGIPTVAMPSKVNEGLELVRQCLKVRHDGQPGLYVSSKCINLIKEFNLYSYPDTGKDEPIKDNDHALDALRYFITYWRRGMITHKTGKVYI